jgi:ribosomal protein S18 acetylase RimI-like enzyme
MEHPEIPSEISVKKLGPDDWQILRDLKIQSISEESLAFEDQAEGSEKYRNRSEEEWRKNLESKNKIFVFARHRNEYVGMASAVLSEGKALIQHVYVAKDKRGLKIGESLLVNLIEILRSSDIKTAELQVLLTQSSAINLYKKLGFQEIKTNLQAAQRGLEMYDEVEMKLDL